MDEGDGGLLCQYVLSVIRCCVIMQGAQKGTDEFNRQRIQIKTDLGKTAFGKGADTCPLPHK